MQRVPSYVASSRVHGLGNEAAISSLVDAATSMTAIDGLESAEMAILEGDLG